MKLSEIKPLSISELKEKNEFMRKYELCSAAELQLRLRSVEIKKERANKKLINEIILGILFVVFGFGAGYGDNQDVDSAIKWVIASLIILLILNQFKPDNLSLLDEETALKVLLATKMSGETV